MTRLGSIAAVFLLIGFGRAVAQKTSPVFTRADTLRGDFTAPGRAWWDVTFYDLHVVVDPADSMIRGRNAIAYRVLVTREAPEIQIDLIEPLRMDSLVRDGRRLETRRDGNAWFGQLTGLQRAGETGTITAYYHGRPRVAPRPPWEGGFTWTTDSLGRPWIATTDQGIGASVWWPGKDTQADEPDSQRVAITVPDPIIDVSNGRLRSTTPHDDGTTTYEWFVTNPINNYGVVVNAGHYAHFGDTYEGEGGTLTLGFWPLDYHLDAARRQFAEAKPVLACFEEWFGPYPWYEDGYKLIEAPHNGMEHQSGVAYGNGYTNGYRGRDGSGTGIGMRFDFIIVHETAHEWWGNNITTRDMADMWVHESFGNYAENLYVECRFGKEAGAEYVIGTRQGIQNDRPIVPPYGVNAQGSGDMYPKGGNMLHTIRQIVGDDETWRSILRGLNEVFRHRIVWGHEIETYISHRAGRDLSKVFDQYLRTTAVPVFEYRIDGSTLSYRWANAVPGFDMPLEVTLSDGGFTTILPTLTWQSASFELSEPDRFRVDPDYYVTVRDIATGSSRNGHGRALIDR